MSRHDALAATAAAVLSLLMVGCPPNGGGSHGTPMETLQSMGSALNNGNRDQFVACFQADANQKKTLEEMFDVSSPPLKLKSAIVKAYGPEGWKKFTAATQAGDISGMSPIDPEKLSTAKVDIKDNQATVNISGQAKPMTLVKDGGQWLVETKQMPKDGIPEAGKRIMGLIRQAFEKVIPEVGKSGQTPETLAAKLDQEMMSARMGGMPPPGGLPK